MVICHIASLLIDCKLIDGFDGRDCFVALEAHFERTIRSEIEFSGIGLHSGAPVSMRLVPAPAGSGIVFDAQT